MCTTDSVCLTKLPPLAPIGSSGDGSIIQRAHSQRRRSSSRPNVGPKSASLDGRSLESYIARACLYLLPLPLIPKEEPRLPPFRRHPSHDA